MVKTIEIKIQDDEDTIFRLTANMEFIFQMLELFQVLPKRYYRTNPVPARPVSD